MLIKAIEWVDANLATLEMMQCILFGFGFPVPLISCLPDTGMSQNKIAGNCDGINVSSNKPTYELK